MSHFIGLKEGLLDPRHVHRLGIAVWLFMWYVRRQTHKNGRVLGGAVLTRERIAADLGITVRTFQRWQERVRDGYVKIEPVPGQGFRARILRPHRHQRRAP